MGTYKQPFLLKVQDDNLNRMLKFALVKARYLFDVEKVKWDFIKKCFPSDTLLSIAYIVFQI